MIFLGQGCRFGPKNRSRQTLELPIFRSRLVPSVATSCQKSEELHALRVDLGMALKKVTPFHDGFLSGYPNMKNVRVQNGGQKSSKSTVIALSTGKGDKKLSGLDTSAATPVSTAN